jgi:hypothetical protein
MLHWGSEVVLAKQMEPVAAICKSKGKNNFVQNILGQLDLLCFIEPVLIVKNVIYTHGAPYVQELSKVNYNKCLDSDH